MTSWTCFVGSKLEPVSHWKAHLFISFKPLFRLLAVLSGTLAVENRDVLSADNLGLHWKLSDKSLMFIGNKIRPNNWRLSDKSLMYIRNKSGPNIESWKTPALILAQHELWDH